MANRSIKTVACLIAVLTANSALGTIRYVPKEHANIQDAINVCQDSDTVVIAPGRYIGPGNRNINFRGKAITVCSTDPANSQIINETIIDCEGQGRGFVFYMGEKADSTISGLTITNGYGLLGGAIYCYNNSSPSITNCVINSNSAVFGGGVACANSNTKPKISNCNITANAALVCGGGFYLNASSPVIKNCIISGNVAPDGGAFYSLYAGNPIIINCTISQNTASRSTGVIIYCYESSNITVQNSILWGNTAPYASQIKVGNSGAATSIQISYCNIQGGKDNIISDDNCTVEWGQGNIDSDPNFVNSGSLTVSEVSTTGDYHLLGE
ncbi:MAG: right-handed parallel beta-helix repeat-containing protein, partial [Planctomycetota bacterium]